jgi:hypothetical protein
VLSAPPTRRDETSHPGGGPPRPEKTGQSLGIAPYALEKSQLPHRPLFAAAIFVTDMILYYRRCVSLIADIEDAEGAFVGAKPSGLVRVDVHGTLARRHKMPSHAKRRHSHFLAHH